MSGREQDTVKVKILDKEYLVACDEDEKDVLLASARYLNDKMTDVRETGKVVGMDRIAVMTALNLAHEVVVGGGGSAGSASSVIRLNELNNRIEEALGSFRLRELN
jgi:cell division protein ZapA